MAVTWKEPTVFYYVTIPRAKRQTTKTKNAQSSYKIQFEKGQNIPCISNQRKTQSCAVLTTWPELTPAWRCAVGRTHSHWSHCNQRKEWHVTGKLQEKGRRRYNDRPTVATNLKMCATRMKTRVSWQALRLERGISKSIDNVTQSPSLPYLLVRIFRKSAIRSAVTTETTHRR